MATPSLDFSKRAECIFIFLLFCLYWDDDMGMIKCYTCPGFPIRAFSRMMGFQWETAQKKENWNMVSAAILQKRKIMQLPGIKCLHSLPTLAWNKTFLPLPLKQNFSLKMVLYKPGLQIQWTPGDFEKDFWVLGIFAYLCIYFWRFFNTVFPFEFWRTLNCLENFP